MFEEINRETAEQQAAVFEERINDAARDKYERGLKAWVENKPVLEAMRLPVPPMPIPPNRVIVYLAEPPDNELFIAFTPEVVSDKTAQDFMPQYATDADAVGGPVGGPIPQQPGHFYQLSSDKTPPGTIHTQISGKYPGKYVKVQEGFAGLVVYWAKIG